MRKNRKKGIERILRDNTSGNIYLGQAKLYRWVHRIQALYFLQPCYCSAKTGFTLPIFNVNYLDWLKSPVYSQAL